MYESCLRVAVARCDLSDSLNATRHTPFRNACRNTIWKLKPDPHHVPNAASKRNPKHGCLGLCF